MLQGKTMRNNLQFYMLKKQKERKRIQITSLSIGLFRIKSKSCYQYLWKQLLHMFDQAYLSERPFLHHSYPCFLNTSLTCSVNSSHSASNCLFTVMKF